MAGFSEFVEETRKGYPNPTWQGGIFTHNFRFDSFQKNRHLPTPPSDP